MVGEVQMNRSQIRHFAKTIIGGMCRRNGSYQEAEEGALGPLEAWLSQSHTVGGGSLGWQLKEKFPFVPLDDSIQSEAGAVAPPEQWLQSLSPGGFAAPPSPFFEDIQVATDGHVFFLTKNGSMGLGPASMRKGDTIHILPNGRTHFVLRDKSQGLRPVFGERSRNVDGGHELVGDCYLHADSTLDNRRPIEEEPAIEGSLPFGMLGARYLKERGLPIRDTVMLI
ncbi:hypothetical protein INS49_009340 [Diaporthe citri]|uniref:uncharacterized protein n=1 Tax=Diaporthe citri TaxID=83186 RepID=UPI001C80A4DE|nr:uncharacterized protein INS49_009340 [Diaporthe citri]KAG6361116.1 hypothetical protein INS49_009340 [Diaporthe citri]